MARTPTAKARQTTVEFLPLDDLVPYARNARKHGEDQVRQLCGLIEEFGWTVPVLVEVGGGIIAGHGRVMAAERLYGAGKTIRMMDGTAIPEGTVPVLVARGWSDAQVKAYVIADNKVASNSEWDEDLLRLELGEIRDLIGAGEIALELDELGFSDADLSAIFADPVTGGDGEEREAYSRKITAPIYQPTGERPAPSELFNDEKTRKLVAAIRKADIPGDVAGFLERAAERHTVFDFRKIAEFYAAADPEVQRLMEQSALVIIDFNQAIENGFVKLTKRLGDLAGRSDTDDDA